MDKLERCRQAIQTLLSEYVKTLIANGEIESQIVAVVMPWSCDRPAARLSFAFSINSSASEVISGLLPP
jgi:hypothetical protein